MSVSVLGRVKQLFKLFEPLNMSLMYTVLRITMHCSAIKYSGGRPDFSCNKGTLQKSVYDRRTKFFELAQDCYSTLLFSLEFESYDPSRHGQMPLISLSGT